MCESVYEKYLIRNGSYQPLVLIAGAFVVGIIADTLCDWTCVGWSVITLACVVSWSVVFRCGTTGTASVLLLMAVASLGGGWHHLHRSVFSFHNIGNWATEDRTPVQIVATLVKRPVVRARSHSRFFNTSHTSVRTVCLVETQSIRIAERWKPVQGHALLFIDGLRDDLQRSDRILINGTLKKPQEPDNPGAFNFSDWMRSRRVRAQVNSSQSEGVRVLESVSRWNLLDAGPDLIERMRYRASEVLKKHFSGQELALAMALILGFQEHLDELPSEAVHQPTLRDALLRSGTIHLLAISGLHVGIIAGLIFFLLRAVGLGPMAASLGVILFMVSYAFLVGARPPVVRAATLVIISCAGSVFSRQMNWGNALAAALILLLLVRPGDLFQTGFQLSFLTTVLVVMIGTKWFGHQSGKDQHDVLDKLVQKNKATHVRIGNRLFWGALRTAGITMLVWLLLTPILLARFHIISPIAVVLNLVLLPLVMTAIFSGFALLGFHVLANVQVEEWTALLCRVSLQWIEYLVQQGIAFPFSHAFFPGPNNGWLLGFYVLVAAYFLKGPVCSRIGSWMPSAVLVWVLAGFLLAVGRPLPAEFRTTLLSVGHGLAVVMQFPSGKTVLYDAGSLGGSKRAGTVITEFLFHRGIKHLDAIILSHADSDHYNAVPFVIDRMSVGEVLLSPTFLRAPKVKSLPSLQGVEGQVPGTSSVETPLLEILNRYEIPIRFCGQGDELVIDPEVEIRVLHPPVKGVSEGNNANSLVVLIAFEGQRLLLTGDLEKEGLSWVLGEATLPVDVLIAPHHGSTHSYPRELIAWAQSKFVIMSQSGKSEDYLGVKAYRSLGVETFSTAQDGAIEVLLSHGQTAVSPVR